LSSTPSFPSSRALRVRRPAHSGKASSLPAAAVTPCQLPPDSLALSLLLAGRVIAEVRAGRSLTQALTGLSTAPGAARAGAQDVAYGTCAVTPVASSFLRRLLERTLPHAGSGGSLAWRPLSSADSARIAAYMVVDQAVAAAGELAGGAFRGLVNGVLRNYLRQRETLHLAIADDDEAAHQHPHWWLSRLRRAYPDRWQEIVAVGNSQPPMTLRVNRRRILNDYVARLQDVGLSARQVGRRCADTGNARCCRFVAGFRRWPGLDPGRGCPARGANP
jgi:16S rRNA (cytosine967-C5)-methyltransferase